MEHTPTPWAYDDLDGEWSMIKYGYDGESQTFAHFDGEKEDAEFIVRACNSHDELVEALKLAYSMLYAHEKALKTKSKTIDIVKQAIAKAEGKN